MTKNISIPLKIANTQKNFKIMKLVALFLTIGISISYAGNSYSQATTLSLELKNKTVREVFNEIEKSSEYIFLYNRETLDPDRVVSISVEKETISDVLDKLFAGTNNIYKVSDRQVYISKAEKLQQAAIAEPEQQQKKTIQGIVVDQEGESVIGANVIEVGTTNGTVTDIDGRFTLQVENNASIKISYIGYIEQEINTAGRTNFDIILVEDTHSLNEVVVVGYGVQKKATVTGAISSIGTEKLVQSPVSNVSNALTGRITGLLAVQREGEPGIDQSTLRIRGEGTFSGSADPLVMVDGIESLNFNNIDPHEIENITILKDASATAVYGVRGANGVILITTKRGNDGKPVLSFSSNVAFNTFTDLRENLGSYEYAINYNEALKYNSFFTGSYSPKFSEEDIEHFRTGDDPIFYPDTDWYSLMLKPVSIQTHQNLNIQGGSDLIKYFVSAGYFSQEGLFNSFEGVTDHNTNILYRRYNLRSNFDFKITERLSTQINLSSQIENRRSPGQGDNTRYMMNRISIAPPYFTPGIVDGKIVNVHDVFSGNPLEQLLSTGYNRNVANYITSSVSFSYDLSYLTKGLRVNGLISYWHRMNNRKIYNISTQTYRPIELPDGGIFYSPQKSERPVQFWENSDKNRKTYFEIGVNYDNQFGDHGITGLLLYNQSKLYDPHLAYVIPNGYQGLVGRLTYDYKMRYLAEFNVGYNGTENFAPGKRFGFFPAFSLGWVISEENFYPQNEFVSYIKLRGTYGEVGNDKIGGNRFLYLPSVYEFYDSYNLGVPGSTFQSYGASFEGLMGNPDLTWEKSKKMNIGVDLSLLNNKVRLVFDYFNENRDNILATPQTTPDIVGTNLPPQNWGKMKNSGYETEINFIDKIANVNYWIQGSFTFARNKILFQDEVKRENAPYQQRTGQSKGQMFGYIAEGFYNTWEEVNDINRPVSTHQNNRIMPGDLKFKDINGDGKIDVLDQVPVGYPDFPEIIYGVSFGADYNGFDFSVLFQGAERVSRMNHATTIRPYENDLMALSYIPKWSWTQEKYERGETIKLPHLTAQQQQSHNYQASTFMIQNARYLRLKNAEIGYRFKAKLLERINISSCRIYLNGNNLVTWDGLFPGDDPEQFALSGDSGYYPLTRTFNLGVNLQF